MKPTSWILVCFLVVLFSILGIKIDGASARVKPKAQTVAYAELLYQRIVGVPVSVNNPVYEKMGDLIANNDYLEAATLAQEDHHFYSVRVRNFAAPMTNKAEDPSEPFNDMQAMIIGVTRDELDARLLLTGNFRYQGYSNLGLPAVSRANNDHYQAFDDQGYDYWANLTQVSPQWSDVAESAGVLTSRAWAKAHYIAGTNRRGVQFTFQEFLCTPIDQWKDPGLPDHFVRRDVDRSPDGNPNTYETFCRNCHAPMDALGGALARFDFQNDTLLYYPTSIAPKYNQNITVYPDGYVTVNDNWINYVTANQNQAFGWRGALQGVGIHDFAAMMANSRGFSACMVKRVFQEVCNRTPVASDATVISSLTDGFEANQYNLKKLFAQVSIDPTCIPHSTP